MPSLELIGPAEEEFGLPVLSAATVGAYTLLRHLGLPAVLPGAGLLLAAEQPARSGPPGAARAAGPHLVPARAVRIRLSGDGRLLESDLAPG